MNLCIDFDNPIIKKDCVLEITPKDLDNFYSKSNRSDKFNLLFVILASIHHYLDEEDLARAAHLCFLASYYLFNPLTPPGSYKLALYYIKKAIELNDCVQYHEWQDNIMCKN